jgi:nucleotide-binding universal stress UspA family protein
MNWQKILVGLDNSNLSRQVFGQALELAKIYQGRLMLVHCISNELIAQPSLPISPEIGVYPEMINTVYENQQSGIQYQLQEAASMLEQYAEIARSQNITVEVDYRLGDPGECTCQIAERWGANLIAIGRRGRKGLAEALLGSVSNHVLHNAPCSVLVIQDTAQQGRYIHE